MLKPDRFSCSQKSALSRNNLYKGNTAFIKDRRVCIKPLRSRLEAIQKLQPPTTAKGCRRFAGMVNFLSMSEYVQNYIKLLKPIHDLTRKG